MVSAVAKAADSQTVRLKDSEGTASKADVVQEGKVRDKAGQVKEEQGPRPAPEELEEALCRAPTQPQEARSQEFRNLISIDNPKPNSHRCSTSSEQP